MRTQNKGGLSVPYTFNGINWNNPVSNKVNPNSSFQTIPYWLHDRRLPITWCITLRALERCLVPVQTDLKSELKSHQSPNYGPVLNGTLRTDKLLEHSTVQGLYLWLCVLSTYQPLLRHTFSLFTSSGSMACGPSYTLRFPVDLVHLLPLWFQPCPTG